MRSQSQRRDYHGKGVTKKVQRFKPPTVAGSGIDPNGSFIEFARKDIVSNMGIVRDFIKPSPISQMPQPKAIVGCTKRSLTQPINSTPVKYKLDTDNISFRANDPSYVRPFQNVFHSILTKPKFSKSKQTDALWEPKRTETTLNNCQSTAYDIITNQENPNAVIRKTTNIDARRCKGITEIVDKRAIYASNYDPSYQNALKDDPGIFCRKNGIFTHMYDASARQGSITMPFDKKQDNGGKPAFKI